MINDYWPCEIFVTNKGEVITLDDSSLFGKHPVIIYSKIGALSYIGRVSDFPETENNKEIHRTESGLRWREKCECYLSEVVNVFVIVPPNHEPIFLEINYPGLRLSLAATEKRKLLAKEMEQRAE